MVSVTSPALSDPTVGVNAPIEALEKLHELNWVKLGLCEECVRDKREEWKGEMDIIWEKMDEWLSIPQIFRQYKANVRCRINWPSPQF